jgi:DNA-binding ferritin-like protein (Dps family)
MQNMENMKSKDLKSKDYYDKYPEIKKKFWGVGPGRRSLSTLKKMDQLIAQLK